MNRYLKAILCIFSFLLAFLSMAKAEVPEKQQGTPQTYTVIKDVRYGLQRKKFSPNDHSSDRLLDLYLPDKKKQKKDSPFLYSYMEEDLLEEIKWKLTGLILFAKLLFKEDLPLSQ